MAMKLKIRRGLKEDLPTLAVGELAYCTDTDELYIGDPDTGNRLINLSKEVYDALTFIIEHISEDTLVIDGGDFDE